MKKQRRGTVITQTDNGILLTKIQNGLFLLPGGQAKRGEPRIIAAIRELKEETNLLAESVIFLFEHESQNYNHKVYLIKTSGTPKASNEIKYLGYYPATDIRFISNSSIAIMYRFLSKIDN